MAERDVNEVQLDGLRNLGYLLGFEGMGAESVPLDWSRTPRRTCSPCLPSRSRGFLATTARRRRRGRW
ncbi:hypothetical protein [Nonomuraea sp. NPDC005501]|uniref:hypothetical protein n=1 Tax=Nonomuraea sp. NPDC005501 TaxID=3156884 RepID=UPI00339FF8B2